MKFRKLILLILVMGSFNFAKAQMTLENTYDHSVSTAYIEGEGYKYYEMDTENNMCRIYNLDHTTYLNISLDVPAGQYLYDLKYVTNHLFDEDDEVEVCYTYYEYVQGDDYNIYTTRVINANGSELVNVPGASYVTLMATTLEGDYKFVAYVYDYSVYPAELETKVYNIPGQTNNLIEPAKQGKFTPVYPNPVQDMLSVPYKLNGNASNAFVKIFSASGKEILKKPLSTEQEIIKINSRELPAGTYIYHIEANGKQMSAGKFIVN